MSVKHPVLQIGSSDSNVPFEMHSMEWIAQNRWEQNSVPHRHNYFVIVWVKNGSGEHLIDLEKYPLASNTVYCLSPGQVHLLKADEGIEGSVISFTDDFLCLTEENYDLLYKSGLFFTFSASPVIHITKEMQDEMEDISQKLMKEYQNFFLLRSEVLRGYLKIFLIYLTRQFEQSKQDSHQSRNTDLAKNFFLSLEKNFAKKKMVADYASEFSVTPNYLNEIIKKVSGFPASEHIKHRVILEAKRHAAYSDVSMKEVAYSLGFEDGAHFSKYFKNATGMNFSDFKKSTGTLFSN